MADRQYTEIVNHSGRCTGCGEVQFAGIHRPIIHPFLDVLLCQECHSRFRNEEFELDDNSQETVCRWCAKGEETCMLANCSSCPYAFCLSCIVRNMSSEEFGCAMKAITERANDDWQCFRCRREALQPLVEKQREFMRRHRAFKLNKTNNAAAKLLPGQTPVSCGPSDSSSNDCVEDVSSALNGDPGKSTDPVKTESSESDQEEPMPSSNGFEMDSDSSIIRSRMRSLRQRKFIGSNSESEDVSECATSGPELDVSKTDVASPLVWRRRSNDVTASTMSADEDTMADETLTDALLTADIPRESPFTVEKIRIENVVHVSPPNSEDFRDASIEMDVGPTGDSQEQEAAGGATVFLESQNNTPNTPDTPLETVAPSGTISPTSFPSPKVKTEPLEPPSTPELTANDFQNIRKSSHEKLRTPSRKSKSRETSLSPPLAIKADVHFIDCLDPDLPSMSRDGQIKTEPKIGDIASSVHDYFNKSRALMRPTIEITDSSDDDLPAIGEFFVKSEAGSLVKVKDEAIVGQSTDQTVSTTNNRKRLHGNSGSDEGTTRKKTKSARRSAVSSSDSSDIDDLLKGVERGIERKKKRKTVVESDSGGDGSPIEVSGTDVARKKEKKKRVKDDDELSSLFLDSAPRSEHSETTDEEISATAKFMLGRPNDQVERSCLDNLPSLLPDSESDFSDPSADSDSSSETSEKRPRKEKKRREKVKKTASEEDARSESEAEDSPRRRTYLLDSCSETVSDSDSDCSSTDDGSVTAEKDGQSVNTEKDGHGANAEKDGQGGNKIGSIKSEPIDVDDDFTPESQADFNRSQERLSGSPKSADDELPNLEPKEENKKKKKKKKKKRKGEKIWSDEETGDGYSEARRRTYTSQKKKYEKKKDKSWDRFTVRWKKRKGPRLVPKNMDATPETPKSPKRRDVRPVINDSALRLATKRAQKEEKDRRARIERRRKEFSQPEAVLGDEALYAVTQELILERDLRNDEPKVEVDRDLIEKLKPHQVQAVQFMWDCCIESVEHHKKTGGSGVLLAHCMGLGKTLTTIVFIHTVLRYPRLLGIRTVLVISPLNAVLNWEHEWDKWFTNTGAKKPRVFEMSQHKTNPLRAACIKDWRRHGGVLIIGYDLFRILASGDKVKNPVMKQTFCEGLLKPGADLVVCDEGHILRNCATNLSNAAQLVDTKRRIVLTGTPLQNNLREYYTMVNFVKPNLLGTKKEFSNQFINPIINGQCSDSTPRDVDNMKARSHVLHDMLSGVILRKDYSVLKPYLQPKYEYVLSIRISERQKAMYMDYLDFIFKDRGWEVDKVQGKGGKLFADFHNFSKICTHPWVFRIQEQRQSQNKSLDDADDKMRAGDNRWKWWARYVSDADALDLALSGKLVILLQILQKSQLVGDRLLVFSQSLLTLDLIEDFLQNSHKNADGTWGKRRWNHGISYFRLDGSTNAVHRQMYCETFNDEKNKDAQLFLISTKAGSLGINLFRANRVVIFDACWNPSYDIQAMFRAYRLGQKKTVYVYRFLAQGTMEEKIYDRQVTKQSLSHRVVDEHQIERHYTQNELAELYKYHEPEIARQKRGIPPVPKDDILAELLQEQSYWLITFHEHDSLLKNKEDEQLSVAQRKAAWAAYEAEKSRGLMALPTRDVPADVIQEVMNQVEGLNMDPDFVREALDILYTMAPNMSIGAMTDSMLMYYQNPDLFDRLKRPYVNTLDHRDYLNAGAINGSGAPVINGVGAPIINGSGAPIITGSGAPIITGAGAPNVNYGAGLSTVNKAGPSNVNYGAGLSTFNKAGPSNVNNGAGPSNVNYGAGPSNVNYGAGPSTVNHGAGPSNLNRAGPPNVNYGVGPSNVNYGAGPSNVNHGAGPSNVNYGAGPSTVNHGAGPSNLNRAGPPNVNYSVGPSNINYGAGPSNVNHGTGPSTSNPTAGQSRVSGPGGVSNGSSVSAGGATSLVVKPPAAPVVGTSTTAGRVPPTPTINESTTSSTTRQLDFAVRHNKPITSTLTSVPLTSANVTSASNGLVTAAPVVLPPASSLTSSTTKRSKKAASRAVKVNVSKQLMSQVLGPEKMKKLATQKQFHLSPNSTDKLRHMVHGRLANSASSPLVAPTTGSSTQSPIVLGNGTTANASRAAFRTPGNSSAVGSKTSSSPSTAGVSATASRPADVTMVTASSVPRPSTSTGPPVTMVTTDYTHATSSAASQSASGQSKHDSIMISPTSISSASPKTSRQEPSRFTTDQNSDNSIPWSSSQPLDLSPAKRDIPGNNNLALQTTSTPRSGSTMTSSFDDTTSAAYAAMTSSKADRNPVYAARTIANAAKTLASAVMASAAMTSPGGTTPSKKTRGRGRGGVSVEAARGRGRGRGSVPVEPANGRGRGRGRSVQATSGLEGVAVSPFRNRRRISSSPYYRASTSRPVTADMPPGGGYGNLPSGPDMPPGGGYGNLPSGPLLGNGAMNPASVPSTAGSTVPQSSTSTGHGPAGVRIVVPNPTRSRYDTEPKLNHARQAAGAFARPPVDWRTAPIPAPTAEPPPAHQPRTFLNEKLAAAVSKASTNTNTKKKPAGQVRANKVGLRALTGQPRKPNT